MGSMHLSHVPKTLNCCQSTLQSQLQLRWWLKPTWRNPTQLRRTTLFRNVKDYGAVGNGKVDDTTAINRAMTDGNRCGAKCGASSIKGAVVYFPTGKFSPQVIHITTSNMRLGDYLISSTIEMYYHTQMIGDVHIPTPTSFPN